MQISISEKVMLKDDVNTGKESCENYGFYQLRNILDSYIGGTLMLQTLNSQGETQTEEIPFLLGPNSELMESKANWYAGNSIKAITVLSFCQYTPKAVDKYLSRINKNWDKQNLPNRWRSVSIGVRG